MLLIECVYKDYAPISMLGSKYGCVAKVLEYEGRYVTGVTQNHLINRTNSDVKQFDVQNQLVGFVPLGIGNFFPYLNYFRMYTTNLKEISKEDLQQFPNLEAIVLDSNKIEVIEADLFENTPKLVYVDFRYNSIMSVGPTIFDSLTRLKSAYFNGNLCISASYTTASEMTTLRQMLPFKCPPTFKMIQKEFTSLIGKLESRLDKLESNNYQVANKV